MNRVFFFILLASGCLFAEASPYIPQFEGYFKEIFRDNPYNLLGKIIEPNDVILEAGGFDGADTVLLAKLVPQGKVITFEPNPPRYEQLVTRTKEYSNVASYPFALGERNEEITFYVCYGAQYDPIYEGASSALPPSESMKINYQGPRIQVPCVRLDDWCKENNQDKIDFMWLDLEGYEVQVLKNSTHILQTVKAIYVETNFYKFREGMTLYKDLRRFLEKNGFRLLSHFYYRGCQGNAIFIKRDLFSEVKQKVMSKM